MTSRGNVPVWSPDGSQIVFRGASGGPITSIAPADGSQPAGKVLEGRVNAWPGDWSRTGNVVVGTAVRAETGSYDLFMKVVGSAEPASYPVASRADETDPRLSPDDRWLAYAERDGSGTWQLHVRAFNRAGGATRVSPRSGRYPRWSRDGRNLYFVDTQGTLMRATVRAGDTFEVVNVQPLFTNAALSAPNDVAFHPPYDLAPDGRRFLVNVPLEAAKPTPIVVLLNWRRALQR